MNIHHLELFYYVAKFGGIMEAVRNMPYGIQQPAVSGQIIQLENNLGKKLFQRRPFSLTPSGQRLFEKIEPFFAEIGSVCDQIREGTSELIRIGAPTMVLDRYFPEIVTELHKSRPDIQLSLREGHSALIQQLLSSNEIDLAVTPLEDTPTTGFAQDALIEIEVCLIVSTVSKIKSADHFWNQDRIAEPLIGLPNNEIVSQRFQEYLQGLDRVWPPIIELSSLDLIERYVRANMGVGIGVNNTGALPPQGIRRIDLPKIRPITVGALWRRQLSAAGEHLVNLCRQRAHSIKKTSS